jgi:hypothetical protein
LEAFGDSVVGREDGGLLAMQYRLSTLLLSFGVVSSSLAIFGGWGIIVAGFLLALAAYIRNAASMARASLKVCLVIAPFLLPFLFVVLVADPVNWEWQCGCAFNLRGIGVALAQYESSHGSPPPLATIDKNGKRMHSWRALLLPNLDQGANPPYDYAEPWDGPNNSKLADNTVAAYRCPAARRVRRSGVTDYVAVTGPGTAWDLSLKTGTLIDVRNVTPVVVAAEVAESEIKWSEPRDLTLDEACHGMRDRSRAAISSPHAFMAFHLGILHAFPSEDVPGANILFSDGTVKCIPTELPPATLRGLLTGDQDAWRACEEFHRARSIRMAWTMCVAPAVLVIFYALLLFRPRGMSHEWIRR